MDNTFDRVERIVRTQFNIPNIVMSDSTTASDVAGWDSLSHALLLMSIEDEFEIEFDSSSVLESKNIGELIAIIERLLS